MQQLSRPAITGRHSKAVDAVKDLRNMGHPGVELREGSLSPVDAEQAVALMKAVIEERKARP